MKGSVAAWLLFILLANALLVSGSGGADQASSRAHGRDASRAVTLIYNVYDLQNMSLDLSGAYELANDIDASATVNWNNGAGFTPVGNDNYPFTGTLDGKGYNISGLFINISQTNYVGLFGYVSSDGSVMGVGLVDCDVTGLKYVGGLVGKIESTVANSHATGNVNGTVDVGGLVGSVYGTADNSYATGNVNGTENVGGLVGVNFGFVNNSHAKGNVNGTEDVGGLVGSDYNSTVANSHATGNVRGINGVGGLVGGIILGGMVDNSYATGNVNGNGSVGGLVGGISLGGTVNNSHATGNVTGTGEAGGLVGAIYSSTVNNSYAMGNVTGTNYTGGLVGFIDEYSRADNSYATGDVTGTYQYVGGLAGLNSGFVNNSYATGNVTEIGVDKYYIGGLLGINFGFVNNSYATGNVTGDHDVGGLVGYIYNGTVDKSYAMGNVNGNGSVGGLVGFVDQYSTVNNSYATGNVNGTGWGVGGLVGENTAAIGDSGTVDNSYATGDITGNYNVGGLVGSNEIPINNSHATGNVMGAGDYIGGLVGDNSGPTNNSYATGNVTGALYFPGTGDCIGGLMGNNSGPINNSHATGNVTGLTYVGGLVGNNKGTVSNSYAVGNVNGGNHVGGLVGNNSGPINNSYAAGNVTGGGYIGGLTGADYDCTVSNSYATGNVNSYGGYVGGLVGQLKNSRVNNSYATGNVNGDAEVGGLVGEDYGTVNNSYATGNVTGTWYGIGGLVGYTFNGTVVDNSYATGDVNGTEEVGGLVGWNVGTLSNSYSTGDVNGTEAVGGLVGNNSGPINNSHATGNVNGTRYVGGLVGEGGHAGHTYGSVKISFATGNVKGDYYVGGLIGNNAETVSNSYARGCVTGTDYVGGLVGANIGMVSNSYGTGYVNGTYDKVGGLVGNSIEAVSNCFWDKETSGQSSSSGGTGKNTAEMKTQITFTNAGWDFKNIWFMIENVIYPIFQWQNSIYPIADAGGDQTVDEGTVVIFDGRGSFDSFEIVNYTWTFGDVDPKTLYGVGPMYKFNNPGIFNVTLKVTNVLGYWNVDTMTVTVNALTPPVSNAGPDQNVDEGTLVTFNGSASSSNGGIVNYCWTFNDGTGNIELYGAAPSHTFNVPGVYAVNLNVTDAAGNWNIDTMTVTVKDITAPIADAGPNQTVDQGTVVTFNGSGSSDNVGVVNFTWTFTDRGPVTLYGARPTYKFDNPGIFVVKLKVADAAGNWGIDNLTVTVRDISVPPSCTIAFPANVSTVSGTINITGIAIASGLPLDMVEVRIDGGDWKPAIGLENWKSVLDTRALTNGRHTIEARAFGGRLYSDNAMVTINVNNIPSHVVPPSNHTITIAQFPMVLSLITIIVIGAAVVLYFRSRKGSTK